MAENWYNKFVIRKFNQILFNHNILKDTAFYKLKTSFDFQEKCIIVDQLPVSFDKYIYGVPFPKNINELGTSNYILESNSIEDEINWFFLSVRKFKEKINEFIELKKKFDNYLLLGDYEFAENTLNEIDSTICHSLWSIENRLLIKELTGGIDENKILLSKINEEKGGHFITQLADFYSKKAENDLLINRFNVELRNFANKLPELFKLETIEYYYFKVNYFEFGDYKSNCITSAVDFQNSIIDRYLTFLKIIYNLICNSILDKKDYDSLRGRIFYISKKITDPLIDRISLYFNEEEIPDISNTDKEALAIFDLYTLGDYAKAEQLIKPFILKNPRCFEFYILYAKCLINQSKTFEPLNKINNYQNKILFETYSILNKQLNPIFHLQSLRKIAYQLSSISISNQIVDLVSQESNNLKKFESLSFLNSLIINPIFSKIYNDKAKAKVYLKSLDMKCLSSSDTIKFMFHNINNTLVEGLEDLNIPKDRKELYTAISYQEDKKYDEAIAIWQSLIESSRNKPHTYETIITNLYDCYLEKGDLNSCISLFVDTYFENQYYIIKLNTFNILEKIRQNKFRGIEININVPIFFRISNSLETRTTAACERFLNKWNVKKPTELIDILKSKGNSFDSVEDMRKHIFFFDKICSVDLFKHMVSIKGTKEKLNERLKIINFLNEIDTQNQKEYQEEIEEINRQILIQEGLQEYDESKIFINEKQIRNSLLIDIEAEFHRFKSIAKIIETNPLLILIDSSTNQFQTLSIKGKEKNKETLSFSSDPIFDLIKGMFMEVRDLFIESDYGLKEYLSARIRHGVFKSEIRPKFEKLKLLTEKDSTKNTYEVNNYWADKIRHFDKSIQDGIQKALSEFSKKIDDLIEEEALKKHLHIRTEGKNKEGWFNYEFDDSELTVYSLILRDCDAFQEFIDEVFNLLWNRTDKNLEYIRNKFTGEVKNQFEKAIVDLELSLQNVIPKNSIPEIYENITTSKVNIQNDLDRIARWFNRIGKQTKEFSINKIIEISITNANKGYGKRKIKLVKNIECDFLFKGELYPSFVDLMYSFFKNTLEYCGLDSGEVETELNIRLEKEKLLLNITNKLYGDIEECVKKFDAFKIDNVRSADEGRSGLKKALRTITSDFGDRNNTLNYSISIENKSFNVNCVINTEKLKYENINN